MAIIEEVEDQRSPTLESGDDIQALLNALKVPEGWARQEWETDETTMRSLFSWKANAVVVLRQLTMVPLDDVMDKSSFIMAIATFDGEDKFSSPECPPLSEVILEKFSPHVNANIIREVLLEGIKPLFQYNPHTRVSLTTGRMLLRPAGGSHAAQDMFEDQSWKITGIGSWNVLRWCIRQLQAEDFESVWPLLVPPLMTLVDDFDPPVKVRGIEISHEMLTKVDTGLLKRTGLDTLLSNSYSGALTFQKSAETPRILMTAIPASLYLIEKTTQPDSDERFERTCKLLVSAVISGAWTYGGNEPATMEASVQVLPSLILALGLGCARFLRTLIPQLSDMLVAKTALKPAPMLQILSAKALCVLVRTCQPRIEVWKYRILDCLLRSWVQLKEQTVLSPSDVEPVQAGLQELTREFIRAVPSLNQVEVPRVLKEDFVMFMDLFDVCNTTTRGFNPSD